MKRNMMSFMGRPVLIPISVLLPVLFFIPAAAANPDQYTVSPPAYDFKIEYDWLTITLKTTVSIESDEKNFRVVFTRRLWENNGFIKEKQWQETIPRQFQWWS